MVFPISRRLSAFNFGVSCVLRRAQTFLLFIFLVLPHLGASFRGIGCVQSVVNTSNLSSI